MPSGMPYCVQCGFWYKPTAAALELASVLDGEIWSAPPEHLSARPTRAQLSQVMHALVKLNGGKGKATA